MGSSKANNDSPTITNVSKSKKRSLPLDCNDADRSPEDVKPPTKRVRFARDNNGEVMTTESRSNILHADLEKSKLWWSRQERSGIVSRCHSVIKDFRRDNMDRVRHYLSVFKQCSQNPTQSSSEYLEKVSVSLPVYIRGLEWGIAPSTKKHRQAHSKEVLETQDQIQSLTGEMRDRILSTRSLRSSRRCRVMARLLGDCDATMRKERSLSYRRRLPIIRKRISAAKRLAVQVTAK